MVGFADKTYTSKRRSARRTMGSEEEHTDPFLGGSEYELIRARSGLSTRWSIPRKVRWCGYLLFAASGLLPVVVSLPAPVRERFIGPDPASAPLAVATVDLLGVLCLVVAAVGLAAVALYRSRLGHIDEDQAWTLVGFEDVFSGIGFVTGGLAVVAALALAAVGFAGVETVQRLVDAGVDPYHMAGDPGVSTAAVSAVAFVCAVGISLLGLRLRRLE